MANYYKPSQWRGKRLLYRSIDPDEPKQEMLKLLRFLVGGTIGLAAIWFLFEWWR
jgi:hypothetical protein